MINPKISWNGALWRVLGVALIAALLVGCTLGQQPTPLPVGGATQTVPVVPPQGVESPSPAGIDSQPPVQVPATITPTPPLLPSETLGPITVQGTEHQTQEPVTITVRRGRAVTSLVCSWTLQGGTSTGQLGTPTSVQIDADTNEDTFTFTPNAAGTYTVSCNGVAQTQSGLRTVTATGLPFTVEAKG